MMKDEERTKVKEEEHATKKVILTWSYVPPIVIPPDMNTQITDGFSELDRELPLPRVEFLDDAPTQ